jgi:hypothetical protein
MSGEVKPPAIGFGCGLRVQSPAIRYSRRFFALCALLLNRSALTSVVNLRLIFLRMIRMFLG